MDFGFNNRPAVVANGCVKKNLTSHKIIVTPVSSPSTKSNGTPNINPGPSARERINIRQNITARYAVNYRSVTLSQSVGLHSQYFYHDGSVQIN